MAFPPSQFTSITITGTSGGGPVPPDANNNINLAGTNITITGIPAANTLDFSATVTSPITWIDVTTSPITMAPNTGYVDHFNGNTQYILPTTAAFGTVLFIVSGQNAGSGELWTIVQNAGQQVMIGADSTTLGPAGSVNAQSVGASLYLVNSVANLRWLAISIYGNVATV